MIEGPLPLLYQDADYVAVHKPPGLLVHRSWISQDEAFLLQRLRDQIGQRVYPVHRLDRATSGVIFFGLSSGAARRLQKVFESGRATKTYRAVVRGWLQAPVLVDHDLDDRESGKAPRPARTRLMPLASVEIDAAVDRYPTARYSLVEAEPLTGRRHQIRRHLKHVDHPIVGDTTWGKGTHNRFFRERFDVHRLLLVSWETRFPHPLSGNPTRVHAARDPEWDRLMVALGWADARD
jgi:tRNA pseudouridine65 synthase